jgi:hypothetical protein
MQDVRNDLAAHADEAVERARAKFAWRCFVANHPWPTLGAAAALGYFLVPRRTRVKACEAGAAAPDRAPQARQPSPFSGVLSGVMSAVAAIIAREGLIFAEQRLMEWFEPHEKSRGRGSAERSDYYG